ncbi:MAG: beta-ketoacyl synthase N-terminal-like domain-containing protein [Deltaproteobacteria bacterium]
MSYPITATAIANCLGTEATAVFERAFAGTTGFIPVKQVYDVAFDTVVGEMPELPTGDTLGCAMTRIATLVLASARQLRPAVHAAAARWGPRRVAYVFASSTGGIEATERTLSPLVALPAGPAYHYANHGIDATSNAVTAYFGIAGVTLAISTACSSGIKALSSAVRLLDRGLADAVVVGSADSLSRTTLFGFHSLGLTAPAATRPFSKDRAGITLGEGSAFVLLERTGEAIASLGGVGVGSDAYHHTTPHPDAIGGMIAMREALDRAKLSPNLISYVSAHGTGTVQNDATEALAIRSVFERAVPVTATKSLTGHTLGTAGLTSVVLAIESLCRQAIPPTLRYSPDPALGVTIVDAAARAQLDHVLVNAFGFGGSNASAVISRTP